MKELTVTDDEKPQVKDHLEKWFGNENKDNEEVEQAKQRLAKLEHKEKTLQELVLEGEIPREDFKEHRMRIEAERANLKDLIETRTLHRSLVRADFETALEVAGFALS